MKILLSLIILIPFLGIDKPPMLQPLINPNQHSGCYLYDTSETILIANLTEVDSAGTEVAIFNFDGQDIALERQSPAAGYPDVFKGGNYKVYLKRKLKRREPESCLEYYQYSIKVLFKKKTYFVKKNGFCGC